MSSIGVFLAEGGWPGPLAAGACVAALPWLNRESVAARTFVVSICIALMWRYIGWRWLSSLPPLELSVNAFSGIVFAGMETLALIGATISLCFLTRIRNRTPDVESNLNWLLSQEQPPLIDVFICTYNEEEAILERTIIGSLAMDYPNYRLWVLDDTRRPWLAALCDRLRCGYITRADNAHAKAGNINNALRRVAALATPPEFVSILDADFVPMPNFLTRAMTLFREGDVGVVQTPQHFANPDPMQSNLSLAGVWPDEQRYFFEVVMASKDAWDAAFCCGTSSIIRFAPLMSIDGFPTDSVTEDYLLSLRLRQIGYRTVYLNEPLSLGLAPEGLREYIVQRSRWCLGFMQICVGRSGPLRRNNGLSIVERLTLIETFLHWSATHFYRLLGLMIPIAFLLFGVQAVNASVTDAVSYFSPYFVVQMAATAWLSQSRALPIMGDLSQLLAATDIVKAVYRGLTKPKGQKFAVTAKGGDRSKLMVQTPLLAIFLTYLVLTIAGSMLCVSNRSKSADLRIRFACAVLELVQYHRVNAGMRCLHRTTAPAKIRALQWQRRGAASRQWQHSDVPDQRHFYGWHGPRRSDARRVGRRGEIDPRAGGTARHDRARKRAGLRHRGGRQLRCARGNDPRGILRTLHARHRENRADAFDNRRGATRFSMRTRLCPSSSRLLANGAGSVQALSNGERKIWIVV